MSYRIKKINELIKRELGGIILKEVDFPRGVLATITRVETSSDLRHARVWISVIPEKELVKTVEILYKNLYNLQHKMNKLLRIKAVPRLQFLQEEEVARAGKIEEFLEKVKKPEKN